MMATRKIVQCPSCSTKTGVPPKTSATQIPCVKCNTNIDVSKAVDVTIPGRAKPEFDLLSVE